MNGLAGYGLNVGYNLQTGTLHKNFMFASVLSSLKMRAGSGINRRALPCVKYAPDETGSAVFKK